MTVEWDEGLSRSGEEGLVLDALTRERLGQQMHEMYEPVIDEPLGPRLTELMLALEQARSPAR
ncbi:hypothetical protein [Methylorubrum extorquens]|uniref:hypothetical protein n=1 Tax=Methylorubrum extorquens TaxID=408 RepID=UPI0002F0AC50|nr:hypothetical protein [Methylorubrum extorquens]KQP93685.1 hypothetical protein ASF55_20535 [Methylobacterium sp. Leaf119]WIU41585.1 hypothetical protein KQ926_09925 [Methylorubrum extorquens]